MKTINNYIPVIDTNESRMNEQELIREVVMKNMPSHWRKDFKKNGYHKLTVLSNIMERLTNYEEADDEPSSHNLNNNNNSRNNWRNNNNNNNEQHNNQKEKNNEKDNKNNNNNSGKRFKNKCRKCGGHEYWDCPKHKQRNNNTRRNEEKNRTEDVSIASNMSEETFMVENKTKNIDKKLYYNKSLVDDSEQANVLADVLL